MTRSVYTLLLFFVTWILTFQPSHAQLVEIENAFTEGFESPVGIEYSQEGSSLLYIVSWSGKIMVKDTQNPDAPSTTFIDITDRVIASGELGLLGLAFSPDFQNDNTFYLYYTVERNGEYYSTLARYKTNNGVGDPDSEERLFELLQPQDNHNGGQITFGSDGYLYIALGDGGRSSRQLAQDTSILNGSILRIDVSPETGYDIPPDNPFVGDPSGQDEIFAWGFRNPWRMSFDKATGDLWVADVGQKDRETIYIVEKGKNYGWPIVEGTLCYPIGSECDKTGLEMPLYEYPYRQVDTGESITGGYVYRGTQNPSLIGKYIYGDFASRRIWALEIDHETHEVISNTEIALSRYKIPTFGVDGYGEMYIGSWAGGSELRIFRFAPELTLTTLALKSIDGSSAVQLDWEVNIDTGIDRFEIYRGSAINDLNLYDSVGGSDLQFIDPAPLMGSTFYAVRAVESDGTEGELSNPVSYYRAQNTLSDSWSMISIPFDTEGLPVDGAIFYGFDGAYSLNEQLVPGKGYWARSVVDGGTEFSAEGAGILTATLELEQGWNLVGAPVSSVSTGSIIDSGSILTAAPIYWFNGSTYEESENLSPERGYWLYADEAGEVIIDLESEASTLPLVTTDLGRNDLYSNFDKIEFTSGDAEMSLFIAKDIVTSELRDRFRLPPLSPEPSLDVRSSDGFKLIENNQFEPVITASDYPVSIRFIPGSNQSGLLDSESGLKFLYEITTERNGKRVTLVLRPGSDVILTEPADRIEFLRVEKESELVLETKLLPSYPNPFNPTTTIEYRLADQQQVNVAVFDVSGRRIATLVEAEQEAGIYTLPFDASNLASGVYFVRFSAGDVFSTQKLTLIK